MGWWITLAILALIAMLPLGVRVLYDSGGARVLLVAGPVKVQVFPGKKKKPLPGEEPEKKEKKKTAPKENAEKPAEKKKKSSEKSQPSGGSITDFLPLVKIVLDLLNGYRKNIRLDLLECKLVLAGDDPADLAENYGKAWAAVGNLWPRLERYFVVKKRDINIECDFTAQETTIFLRAQLTITVGRLLRVPGWHGLRAAVQFLKIMNQRKGGATT